MRECIRDVSQVFSAELKPLFPFFFKHLSFSPHRHFFPHGGKSVLQLWKFAFSWTSPMPASLTPSLLQLTSVKQCLSLCHKPSQMTSINQCLSLCHKPSQLTSVNQCLSLCHKLSQLTSINQCLSLCHKPSQQTSIDQCLSLCHKPKFLYTKIA